eukprot:9493678-Pyramimonas_sp.AAC.1
MNQQVTPHLPSPWELPELAWTLGLSEVCDFVLSMPRSTMPMRIVSSRSLILSDDLKAGFDCLD